MDTSAATVHRVRQTWAEQGLEAALARKRPTGRRTPNSIALPQEVTAWERRRKTAKCRVAWRFTTPKARIKLQRLYPSIQLG